MSDTKFEGKENTDAMEAPSSDSRLTRAEFLKKALIAGGVLSAPVVLDKFLVRSAPAMSVQGPKRFNPGG